LYAGFKKFARKKTDNLFGNDKKKAAGKAEHLNDKAPKNVVKHTDPPKGPVKNMEKPAPGKQKPTEINSKAPANAPDTDVPNAPATKHTPEMKNTDPAPSNTNVEKLEKDIHPENSAVDKADAPKDQKVANGEKEPQSAVLNDDPNIEESNLKDLKKYEDDVDPSTKKKMKDKADGEVEKGPNHNSKTKALVMARIIAETNDKVDTPVLGLMAELAPLKAMKGVNGFDYENGNAPGEFKIIMYGSKYIVTKYTIEELIVPSTQNKIEVGIRDQAIAPINKVDIYSRGKVSGVKKELTELQIFKQKNRKLFDADPENEKRLLKLKDQDHNYDRSQSMAKQLDAAGLTDTPENNEKIIDHLLDVGNKVTPENRVWFKSVLEGPNGKLEVQSTWKILEDGKKYLTTVNFIPIK
jgi:hypothetical protein